MMNTRRWIFLLLPILALTVQGCEAVEFIFKGGMWVGAILVIAVFLIIFSLIRRRG